MRTTACGMYVLRSVGHSGYPLARGTMQTPYRPVPASRSYPYALPWKHNDYAPTALLSSCNLIAYIAALLLPCLLLLTLFTSSSRPKKSHHKTRWGLVLVQHRAPQHQRTPETFVPAGPLPWHSSNCPHVHYSDSLFSMSIFSPPPICPFPLQLGPPQVQARTALCSTPACLAC